MLLASIVLLFVAPAAFGEGLLNAITYFGGTTPAKRRNSLVFAAALARIAERSPTPELQMAVRDLREIAADSLQQDRRIRATSRAAARQIDELTARLKELPVTASVPQPDAAALPVTSEAPTPHGEALPRVP